MGLIKRIGNGDIPLAQTYWGYGVCVGILWGIILEIFEANSTAILFLMLAYLPYQVFINMGIWRAANNYKKSLLLAWLAKIGATLGTLFFAIATAGLFSTIINQNSIAPSSNPQALHTVPNAIVLDEKIYGNKIGATWNWEKLDVDTKSNWWIGEMGLRDKFNIVSVWLKTESLKRAKELGRDYNYSVMLVTFSCSDASYQIVSITEVFLDANRADEQPIFKEMFDRKFKKLEVTGKNDHLIKAYNKVCLTASPK
jgi:hypothetical protein